MAAATLHLSHAVLSEIGKQQQQRNEGHGVEVGCRGVFLFLGGEQLWLAGCWNGTHDFSCNQRRSKRRFSLWLPHRRKRRDHLIMTGSHMAEIGDREFLCRWMKW